MFDEEKTNKHQIDFFFIPNAYNINMREIPFKIEIWAKITIWTKILNK